MVIDMTPTVTPSFERQWNWKGFVPYGQYMDVWEVRVEWPCDDSGGETVPASWVHQDSGTVCLLQSARPEIGRNRRYGVYVALYRQQSDWIPA